MTNVKMRAFNYLVSKQDNLLHKKPLKKRGINYEGEIISI
jgi:hypothetical protein